MCLKCSFVVCWKLDQDTHLCFDSDAGNLACRVFPPLHRSANRGAQFWVVRKDHFQISYVTILIDDKLGDNPARLMLPSEVLGIAD